MRRIGIERKTRRLDACLQCSCCRCCSTATRCVMPKLESTLTRRASQARLIGDANDLAMMGPTRRTLVFGAAGLTAFTLSKRASASSYPDHPVTLVVPFAPGGSTDILARVVAERLRQSLGQPVIVENRSGASGNIGTTTVARAAPDGYVLLFNTMSVHTMNHALFATMPFDGVKDFAPIGLLAYVTNTMVVHPSVPARTVAEFVEYAKQNPGKISYASAGLGSTNHLSAALFEKLTGARLVHVPYRGGAPAVA